VHKEPVHVEEVHTFAEPPKHESPKVKKEASPVKEDFSELVQIAVEEPHVEQHHEAPTETHHAQSPVKA